MLDEPQIYHFDDLTSSKLQPDRWIKTFELFFGWQKVPDCLYLIVSIYGRFWYEMH